MSLITVLCYTYNVIEIINFFYLCSLYKRFNHRHNINVFYLFIYMSMVLIKPKSHIFYH